MYTPTNPFTLAWAALTAPNARAYYAMRAQQDAGLVIWAVATAATAAYALGAEVADLLRVAVVEAQPEPAEPLALPVSLEAVAMVAMGVWAAARNAAHEAVDVLEAEIVEPLALAPVGFAGYLPAAPEHVRVRPRALTMAIEAPPKRKRQAKPKARKSPVRKAILEAAG